MFGTKKVTLALLVAAAMFVGLAPAASADEVDQRSAVAGYSAAELDASFERVTTAVRSGSQVSGELDTRLMESVTGIAAQALSQESSRDRDGIRVSSVPAGGQRSSGTVSPNISGGKDRGGYYIVFSAFEQDLVINGWGWGLAAAICAVPGVGWALCSLVALSFTVLTTYAGTQKSCKGRPAKVYPNLRGPSRLVCL